MKRRGRRPHSEARTKILQFMRKRGILQKEIAFVVGRSISNVSPKLSGTLHMRRSEVDAICFYLKLPRNQYFVQYFKNQRSERWLVI